MYVGKFVGLDFETYSGTSLPLYGLHNYAEDKDFKVLLAAVCWKNDFDEFETELLDFVKEPMRSKIRLTHLIENKVIAAHNAGFEREVLWQLGLDLPAQWFIDTAVLARMAGASGKLEAAAPQLLGVDKMAAGHNLIRVFSIPGYLQEESNDLAFNSKIIEDNPDKWKQFGQYCMLDAELCYSLAELLLPDMRGSEAKNMRITMDMNKTGWFVDLPLVEEMQERYEENNESILEDFNKKYPDTNINSYIQMKEWCAMRGVRADSFDEGNVARMIPELLSKLKQPLDDTKKAGYSEVLEMLRIKQQLGGSSMKKLDVLLRSTGDDGRLYDQYVHAGAAVTWRTTGRDVQMQNLPRLTGEPADVMDLYKDNVVWSNEKMSHNLRQVFRAEHKDGLLIVGDFSSVESRGLAWLAGEQWKLDAYMHGKDLYKELASRLYDVPVEKISPSQRMMGKVAELACGYGAGAGAVRSFAKGMGLELSEGEAGKLVRDWRHANRKIVDFWYRIDGAMHEALETGRPQHMQLEYAQLSVYPVAVPYSLHKLAPNSMSLRFELTTNKNIMTRIIHGCERVGRDITYYRPTEKKSGSLWINDFADVKTKTSQKLKVYGGKMAGILTQSLCREVFFMALRDMHDWCEQHKELKLVGQFHDEMIVEWEPVEGGMGWTEAVAKMRQIMSEPRLVGFPINAEIKKDFRYIK